MRQENYILIKFLVIALTLLSFPIISRAVVFNVKDFGAKGDGVTNDTAAIQAAIDQAAQISGEIYFPAGTYIISFNKKRLDRTNPHALLLVSGVTLRGDGAVSKIKMAYPENTFVYDDGVTAGFSVMFTTRGNIRNSNITIKDIEIDGNQNSIPLAVTDLNYERFNGFFLANVQDVAFQNNIVHDVGGNALYIHIGSGPNLPTNIQVKNNTFYNIDTRRILGMAILFQHASNSIADSNTITDSARGIGFETHDVYNPPMSNITISNNTLRRVAVPIELAGDVKGSQVNMTISSNIIDNSEPTLINNIQGAIVVSYTDRVTISNNTITGGGGTANSAIWIRASDDLIIRGNTIKNFKPAQVFDAVINLHSEPEGSIPISHRPLIESNTLEDNKMPVVKLQHAKDAVIKNNTIKNNVGDPLVFGEGFGIGIDLRRFTSSTLVSGNLIEGNGYGIRLIYGVDKNTFRNNTIKFNKLGGVWIQADAPQVGSGNDFGTSAESGSNCLEQNQSFGLRVDIASLNLPALGNFWGCSLGPGTSGCDNVSGSTIYMPVQSSCQALVSVTGPSIQSQIIPRNIVNSLPKAPQIRNGEALSSSIIRWYFTDKAGNETGFVVHDQNHKTVTSSGLVETTDIAFLDEINLVANKEYCQRHVHAFNFHGESEPSTNFACIKTKSSSLSTIKEETVPLTTTKVLTKIVEIKKEVSEQASEPQKTILRRDLLAERKALGTFIKIFGFLPRLDIDWKKIHILSYDLKPKQRSLEKERQGLKKFIKIQKRLPKSSEDWSIFHAIVY